MQRCKIAENRERNVETNESMKERKGRETEERK
jgi:hypothetical protein